MSKRFVTIISVFALMVGLVGVMQAAPVSANHKPDHTNGGGQDNHVEVKICHATNSHSNPYTVNTIDDSSIDEENNQYLNGHGDHTGPVWHEGIADHSWGDIIPPFTNSAGSSFEGQNWTPEGQAIYNNNCEPVDDEEGEPNVSALLVCNVATKTFTLTITNSGDASSEISLNGDEFTLGAGESVDKSLVDNGEGVTIELLVDGVVYGEGDNAFDGTRPFFCKQGSGGGGETPTTPTTPSNPATANGVASLPVTGGIAPLVSLIAILSTVVAAAASYLWQNRAGSQL